MVSRNIDIDSENPTRYRPVQEHCTKDFMIFSEILETHAWFRKTFWKNMSRFWCDFSVIDATFLQDFREIQEWLEGQLTATWYHLLN